MGAIETENYVHAAGTFAGVDPPPAPIDPSGVVAQQGFSSFTRNGVGDYTLGLELAIGFLEAEVRVQPGLNQVVVIGGQVDPDTQRVQVRCYDSLGNPADCQIFTVQVLKIAVGPEGQLPIPAVPTPILPGALCPTDVKTANYTAAAGELVLVLAEGASDFTIEAPPNPSDCDEFGVLWLASGFNNGQITIDGNGEELAPPASASSSGPSTILIGGVSRYVFLTDALEPGVSAWLLAQPPTEQGVQSGHTSSFHERSNPGDDTTIPAINWTSPAPARVIRWLVEGTVVDPQTDDIAQFLLQAIFVHDAGGTVTQKSVVDVVSVKQGSLAGVVLDFVIAGATMTLQVTGIAANATVWDLKGCVVDQDFA